MKTMRIALIAALIACTMVCLASTDGIKPHAKKVVNVTFVKAIQIPGMIAAMYQQLDPGFLNNNQQFYTQHVSLGSTVYRITGTYEQWKKFFNPKFKVSYELKPVFGHN